MDNRETPNFTPSDHDMLIRLDTKIDFLLSALSGKADQRDVTELRAEVASLKAELADVRAEGEKQKEFRWKLLGMASGVAGVVTVVLKFLIGH
jgi:hypothetical protein